MKINKETNLLYNKLKLEYDKTNPIYDLIEILKSNWKDDLIYLLFTYFFENIDEIKYNQEKIKCKEYKWKNIHHKYPLKFYKYSNMDYDTFTELYNKRELKTLFLNNAELSTYITDADSIILNIIKDTISNIFISLDILLYIENNINYCDYYNFDHLELYYFYSVENNIQLQQKKIINLHYIKHIYIITKILFNIKMNYNNKNTQEGGYNNTKKGGNNNDKILLIFYDTPNKKKIHTSTSKSKLLSSFNINSGSSSSGYQIIIWRKEELLKVLFHEVIHYLDLDTKHEQKLDNIINIKIGTYDYPILINEAITEATALLFHTIYCSIIIYNKKYTPCDQEYNLSILYKKFKILYIYENIFNWYQNSKILNYFNIKEFNIKEMIKYNQTTNCFSYYFIKSLLNLNISDIIFSFDYINNLFTHSAYPKTKIINNSHNTLCNVNTCNTIVNNIILYLKPFITETSSIHDKKIINLINNVIKNIQHNDNSLKMSILNLDWIL